MKTLLFCKFQTLFQIFIKVTSIEKVYNYWGTYESRRHINVKVVHNLTFLLINRELKFQRNGSQQLFDNKFFSIWASSKEGNQND